MNNVACFFRKTRHGATSESATNVGAASDVIFVNRFPYEDELTPVLMLGSALHLGGSRVRVHDGEGHEWANEALSVPRTEPEAEPPLGEHSPRPLRKVSVNLTKPGKVVASLSLADGREVVVGAVTIRQSA